MQIIIVVAVALNGVIGYLGKMAWPKIVVDLARFKKLTLGHAVIMGRRTYESIGKPLPGRLNIVLSRNPELRAKLRAQSVRVFDDLDTALRFCRKLGCKKAFIIGGEEVYKEALPKAHVIERSLLYIRPMGDTYFYLPNTGMWVVIKEAFEDPASGIAGRFETRIKIG